MTADFLKEEARMKAEKRFEESLEMQEMAMYMALVSALGARFDKGIKAFERRNKRV